MSCRTSYSLWLMSNFDGSSISDSTIISFDLFPVIFSPAPYSQCGAESCDNGYVYLHSDIVNHQPIIPPGKQEDQKGQDSAVENDYFLHFRYEFSLFEQIKSLMKMELKHVR